ncbi:hypothetical protein PR003_g27893 [Phytophthora rubi]|uniref:Uncharacterized protein n=1 Tax=Phytophthora rubi TaxID=129364 RepID=A0A6A3HN77_9STRA|nr:hypothetical protein PR001_g29213 [Phytophthora rubi]KAE8971340.1 hypothetical protein PR002_g26860 [Phytophthora rubi]KAE9280677.1 hypothetical protein PR003_g27893 [Phytophthora rubi]
MVKLLTKAKARYDNPLDLMKAVKAGDLKATNILVGQNNPSAITAALFEAPTSFPAVLEVLVEHIDQKTIRQALTQSGWKTKALQLLVEKCDPSAYAAVFLEAATQCRTALMELMLDKVDSCTLTRALASAVSSGHSEVVKILLDVCDASSLSFAMETAAITGQSAMVELLRGRCDAKSKRKAAAKAKAAGCDDVVQMLESKRARLK